MAVAAAAESWVEKGFAGAVLVSVWGGDTNLGSKSESDRLLLGLSSMR